jgi:hypothetical protein
LVSIVADFAQKAIFHNRLPLRHEHFKIKSIFSEKSFANAQQNLTVMRLSGNF